MTEWKSLANAVIHDDFDPRLAVTYIVCEKCKNPFMYNMAVSEYPPGFSEYSRMTIHVYLCPECGHKEMDVIGTYGLPDYLPGTILPFIGHFMMFTMGTKDMLGQLERKLEP